MIFRALSYVQSVVSNRSRRRSLPRFLTYTVTFGCNARCIMCDSWKMPTVGDLTLNEVERIFEQLPRMDAVRLTGGEPFVRKDFGEIAGLAQQLLRPLVLHITTNGFLTDRIVEFCEQRLQIVTLFSPLLSCLPCRVYPKREQDAHDDHRALG